MLINKIIKWLKEKDQAAGKDIKLLVKRNLLVVKKLRVVEERW